MATITIKRPIILKVIVTENFKQQTIKELRDAANKMQVGIQQMEFQAKRYLTDLQKTDISRAIKFREQFETEKNKQEAIKRQIEQKIKEIENLALGSEYTQGTIESFVDVKEGDNIEHLLTKTEIVVEDSIIKVIRE